MIAKNEASIIRSCLESISDFKEIVLIDDESTDETVAIAKEFSQVKVVTRKMTEGFGPQRNYALDLAAEDWVLILDPDERLTPELHDEIARVIVDGKADGYRIKRRNLIFGAWLDDHVPLTLRLSRRGKSRFTDKKVDEALIVDGKVSGLKHTFLHESKSHASIKSYYRIIVKDRSTLTAMDLYAMGRRVTWYNVAINFFFRPIVIFFQKVAVKRGFIYGWRGFVLAFFSALAYVSSYVKLWKLQRKRD
jgi:glycosyltransferase involved in cell wall biosynthesis